MYQKPRVQPLVIPLNVLLPGLCRWYKETPNTWDRQAEIRKIVERYNAKRVLFNQKAGTDYPELTYKNLVYWLRCCPSEKKRIPYLDEILILADSTYYEYPSQVLSNYQDWISGSFDPAITILRSL